jgi:arsenical pump membrane protein
MSAMLSGIGLVVTAFILVGASALHADLGLPTFFAGIATTVVVLAVARESPFPVVKHVSWGILPLVAGLFVVVEAVNRTGISATQATAISGAIAAFVSNAVNNLPAGLFAGSAVQAAQVSDQIAGGVLIGVDLGPNLSVTGSLATILWLSALRREGIAVSGLQFLKLGILIMIPALSLSLAALALMPLALGR